MMRTIAAIGKTLLLFLGLLFFSFVVSYGLMSPLSYINVGVLFVSVYVLMYERGRIVWLMLLYGFCLELLFPSSVFGALLFASTIAALSAYWCYTFFLSNRSVYSGLLLGVVTLIVYRAAWILYLGAASITGTQRALPQLSLDIFIWELIMTELALVIMFMLFIKKRHTGA